MGFTPSTACLLLLLHAPGAFPQTVKKSLAQLERQGFEALGQGRYDSALDAFELLLVVNPDRASAHYGKGLALTGMLNYSAAVDSLENAASLDPNRAETWRRLVTLYSQLQRDEKAKRAFENARRLAPVPDEERLGLARALRKTGWLKEAHALLREAEPLGAEEYFELGLLALEEDDSGRAEAHFEKATADPIRSAAEAEYQYGRTLETLGKPEPAIQHYRRALSKDQRLLSARFRLGTLLLRTGDAEQGRALLRGYEELRQWDRRVNLLLSMVTSGTLSDTAEREKKLELVNLFLQAGAFEDAGALIHSALAKDSNDPAFLVAQAEWLLSSGQPDKSRVVLDTLVSVSSPLPDALWLSGRLHIIEGEPKQALESFQRLIAIDPDPPAALLKEVATAYAMSGQSSQAETYFHRAIQKDPLLAGAQAGLGALLESTGRLEEAEQRYRRALEINPDLLSAQQLLAELLLRRGDAEDAVTLLRRSVTTNPANALLRRNLARALERVGNIAEGEAELEKAREIEARKSPRTK